MMPGESEEEKRERERERRLSELERRRTTQKTAASQTADLNAVYGMSMFGRK